MIKNKIKLIQLWLGPIPDYFWYHYETTKNIGIDFLFVTDQVNFEVEAKNYEVIYKSKKDIENLLTFKTGEDIVLVNNKKTCDVKVSLGDLFDEYLIGYDFFGCYDIDTLFGDITKFLKEIESSDIITIADREFHNRLAGPFLIFKNTEYFRKLYNNKDFYRVFENNDVVCYEEHDFSDRVIDSHNVKFLYDVINCETNNGGKNTYDVRWSGGKMFVNGEEKMIYHFYRKNHTIFDKIGNQIYGRYDKKFVDDFFWIFGFTENYSDTVKYLMDSIKKYSNRRCIIYTINFDYKIPDKFLTSEQFVFRRIDIEEGKKDYRGRDENIISCKPKLMVDAIEQYPESKFIYIDSDIYLTVSADDLADYFQQLENYPLINSHIHDRLYLCGIREGEEWTSTVDVLADKVGVEICVFPRRKTNVMLFDKNSRWFFEEQIQMYEEYRDTEIGIFSLHDEDSANVILSKYKLHNSIRLCDIEETDDIEMSKFTDTNHPFHMTGISEFVKLPEHRNDVAVFHGLKTKERFESIQKVYGNTVLDCEEILVYYKDETVYFEKNSFLSSKKIHENVNFIVKTIDGKVVLELSNQEIFNYFIFYISDVLLTDNFYIVEIVGVETKIKLYNNVLEIK